MFDRIPRSRVERNRESSVICTEFRFEYLVNNKLEPLSLTFSILDISTGYLLKKQHLCAGFWLNETIYRTLKRKSFEIFLGILISWHDKRLNTSQNIIMKVKKSFS